MATVLAMGTKDDLLTLPELLEQTNALLGRSPDLTTSSPIEERTLRYWVQEELLPRIGTRGPGSRYPRWFVHRLVFIRMLQQQRALTLGHIRDVLARVDEGTVRRVAEGSEPLEVRSTADSEEIGKRRDRGEEMLMLSTPSGPDNRSATEYLDSVRGRFRGTSPKPARSSGSTPATEWRVAWQGDDIQIRVRGRLSQEQRKRLRLAGELLQSLSEEKKP